MKTGECPTIEELSDLARGTLCEDAIPGLTQHMEVCSVCSETMVQLESHPDALAGLLRKTQSTVDGDLLKEKPLQNVTANLSAMEIGFNEKSGDSGRPARQSTDASGHHIPQPGERLGQYLLLTEIGRGGMGVVYKARQEKLNKIFALKVLSAACMHQPDMEIRFQREMKAAGRIDHPNVVRASDADEVGGVHFLVMEYVEGVDLSHMLRQLGPVSVEHACAMIRMAALGLSEIHQAKMVHRDVKPGNLMLSRDGHVKILDLGLALLHPGHLPLGDNLTSITQLMGTVDYMSPEQANNTHEVDFRADIYGLGATLFALLTDRSPLGDRHQTLLRKLSVLANDSVPSVLEFRSETPEELAKLVSRMLNRDPFLRPGSAADVAAALEVFSSRDGLSQLVENYQRLVQANNSPAGTDAIYDTVVLNADDSSLTEDSASAVEESATTAASTSYWMTALSLGFAVFLIGTLWWMLQPDRSAGIAKTPTRIDKLSGTIISEDINNAQDNVNGTSSRMDDQSGKDSTASRLPLAPAELHTIATSSAVVHAATASELPWHIFASDVDPDTRANAIHRATEIVPVPVLLRQMLSETNPSVRAGLLLAITEFEQHVVLKAYSSLTENREDAVGASDLIEMLLHWYVADPDPEVHACTEFLLRHWGQQDRMEELRPILEQKLMPFDGGWYQPLHVAAMVVIPGPRTEEIGSPADEPNRFVTQEQVEDLHTVTVPYTFAMGLTEITRYQYWRCRSRYWEDSPPVEPDLPVNEIRWEHAAEFCNSLSRLNGIEEKDFCYSAVMTAGQILWRQKPDALDLSGYRLPTDDEWEIACRAGTKTSRPFGNDLAWTDRYSVCNSAEANPINVASRKPNSLGLFDMLGNVSEWIHTDTENAETEKGLRRIRGGSAWTPLSDVRSAARFFYPSRGTSSRIGFRVARTILRDPYHNAGTDDVLSRVEILVGPPACAPPTEAFADPAFYPLLDQQVIQFGTWDARDLPTRSFRLRNKSAQPLRMTELPSMSEGFEYESEPSLEIAPHASADFRIRIPLHAIGDHTHDLRFHFEDQNSAVLSPVRLHGCIEGPLLEVFPVGRFGDSEASVNLGSVPLNSKSGTRLFMRNIGDQSVEATVTEVSGPFTIVDRLQGTLVPHQMDKSFRVLLDASEFGPAEGEITLRTNQDLPAEFRFTLRADVSSSKAFSAIGVFRNGTWLIDYNRDSVIDETIKFGTAGDHPLTGDWNADGICDIAVWHATGDGRIIVQFRLRGDPAISPLATTEIYLASDECVPVAGDMDGDGRSEIGYVIDQVPGRSRVWGFDTLHNETFSHHVVFGPCGSDPIIGDWNGDGIDDIAVSFHGAPAPDGTRLWQTQESGTTELKERIYLSPYDAPVAGDWDGDGDDDFGGWRPMPKSQPSFWQFETSGDVHSECDLEGPGELTDLPFVLRRMMHERE